MIAGEFRGNRRNRGGDNGRDESTGEADFADALLVDDFGNAATGRLSTTLGSSSWVSSQGWRDGALRDGSQSAAVGPCTALNENLGHAEG